MSVSIPNNQSTTNTSEYGNAAKSQQEAQPALTLDQSEQNQTGQNQTGQSQWQGASNSHPTPNNVLANRVLARQGVAMAAMASHANTPVEDSGVTVQTSKNGDPSSAPLTSAFDDAGSVPNNNYGGVFNGAYTMDRNGDGVADYGEAYTYDSNGQVTGRVIIEDTNFDGSMDTQSHTRDLSGNGIFDTTTTVVYDADGNLSSRSVAQDVNEDGVMDFAFHENFDAQGNRTSFGTMIFEDGMLGANSGAVPQNPDVVVSPPPVAEESATDSEYSSCVTTDSAQVLDAATDSAAQDVENTAESPVTTKGDIENYAHAAYLFDSHDAFDDLNRGGARITLEDLVAASRNEALDPEVRAAADYLYHNRDERRALQREIDNGPGGRRGDRRISEGDIAKAAGNYASRISEQPDAAETDLVNTATEAVNASDNAENTSNEAVFTKHDITNYAHAAYLIKKYDKFNAINGGGLGITHSNLRSARHNDELPIEVRAAVDYLFENRDEKRLLERFYDDGKRGARGDRRIREADIDQAAREYARLMGL